MQQLANQLGIIRWEQRQKKTTLFVIGEPQEADDLLTAMLKSINITRNEIHIVNLSDCQADQLNQQIKHLAPRLLLAMGQAAAQNMLGTTSDLDALRGTMHEYGADKIPLIVTYHPLDLQREPQDKKKAYQDLLLCQQLLLKTC